MAHWLDTSGYPTGVIQGRWFQCDSQPVPAVRKVAFTEVHDLSPAGTKTVTSAERERRRACQERSLW